MAFFDFFSLGGRSRHEKAAEQFLPTVDVINKLEPHVSSLSDEALKQYVLQWKGKSVNELEKHVAEIFAGTREAAKRTLAMRHFDVQLLGGLALLKSSIAEMRTGEGKTLVATLPLIYHALSGKGAHLVTVNEYLARRDGDWMRPVYEFFGLTLGVILSGQSPEEKRAAYNADITYGTNNEFGFDYLRDNMAQSLDHLAQRGLHYALVDEVDSILIDEARTPLIISAPDADSTTLYGQFSRLVPQLTVNEHYNIDEKRKAATLTDTGVTFIEQQLGIENMYAEKGIRFVHHLEQALRANTLYTKDKDYIVQEGKVVIVDEFTGRLMEGRRYSEGLHQALEAKENVAVQQESRTLASVTFQNFFRLYSHIGGMTGTAITSAEEFEKVYNLDVVVIPTNQKMVRVDKPDKVYINEQAKFHELVENIKLRHEQGQPVLVGTIAIEKSEYISQLLKTKGVPHEVLNAKQHAREAEIIARAGQKGAVTISTNMAGRGTDIKLGENVASLGGLCVLGTERHEARRIDNQLRGRSGRQGDPGETQFYVSMEDDVMRVFGGSKIKSLMERMKIPENEPIENRLVSKALEGAQERVEGYYFDMRKQVLSYDNVLNKQRNAIYTLRRLILENGTWKEPNMDAIALHDRILELAHEQAEILAQNHTVGSEEKNWNIKEIAESVSAVTNVPVQEVQTNIEQAIAQHTASGSDASRAAVVTEVGTVIANRLTKKQEDIGVDSMKQLEKYAALRSIDALWMDHLDTMDYLRTGIGLRGYGQRDPLVEYQKESHRLFTELLATIKASLLDTVLRAEAVKQEEAQGIAHHDETGDVHELASGHSHSSPLRQNATEGAALSSTGQDGSLRNPYKDVGRNNPCPCNSGKKFKKCHGS
ncbi:MAG: preprotein translocase subunit SecA [bacterium]|nr:preprotein translocase subunit SecA [bacterium]